MIKAGMCLISINISCFGASPTLYRKPAEPALSCHLRGVARQQTTPCGYTVHRLSNQVLQIHADLPLSGNAPIARLAQRLLLSGRRR